MPTLPSVCGFAPATWGGAPIAERGVNETALNSTHYHFGINGSVAAALAGVPAGLATIGRGWGPRMIHVARYGGTVAEVFWCKTDGKAIEALDEEEFDQGLDEFGGFIATFGATARIDPSKAVFPAGARQIAGMHAGVPATEPLGGRRKGYIDTSGFKAYENTKGVQMAVRFSKSMIAWTVSRGGTVHFHLDGMGDIKQICEKIGDAAYNVTSRELRFARRKFSGNALVKYYNGYRSDDGSENWAHLRPVEVAPPWEVTPATATATAMTAAAAEVPPGGPASPKGAAAVAASATASSSSAPATPTTKS